MNATARERHLAEICVDMAGPLVDDTEVVDLARRLTAHCVDLLHVQAAGIMLLDEGGTPRTVVASDAHAHLLGLFALLRKQGPCTECCRSGAGRTDVDLARPAGTLGWPQFAARARATGYVRVHAIPLCLREHTVGALTLFQTTPRPLGDEDTAVARGLADLVAIAIHQQRVLKRSRDRTRQLTGALTSRVAVEQVKGMLAERWNTSGEESFAVLRAYVRAHRLRLSDVAEAIVAGTFDTACIPAPAATATPTPTVTVTVTPEDLPATTAARVAPTTPVSSVTPATPVTPVTPVTPATPVTPGR
ncbi:GAF domain-containing protein [Streptomyces sp. NPDC088785]|uniref:GAF domain-containing protein n=1 Tax=Streptomyces sp. NPDC088785 TaxID=3365897 RepID=UPI0038003692